MKLKSSVQITLIIVVGIIFLTLVSIFTLTSVFSSSKDSLQVNGQSTIKVTPDLITLSYNVETKGNTSKEAENLNSDIVNDLIYRVVQLGFDKTDLKTACNHHKNPWPNVFPAGWLSPRKFLV